MKTKLLLSSSSSLYCSVLLSALIVVSLQPCQSSAASSSTSESKNLLFFFPISTYSHRIPVWPLVERMLEQGHNVTFVSPYPPKEPNPKVTEFSPESVRKFVEENEEGPVALQMRANKEIEPSWFVLDHWGLTLCELFLTDPETQEWVKTAHFDLVVIDGLYNDCGLGLAYKFKAKHMIFDTSAVFMWQPEGLAIPAENSWIPDMQYHYQIGMTFIERFWTTTYSIFWHLRREYYYLPKLTEMFREHLQIENMPSAREMEKNVSLVLMNSHFSEEFARPLPPHVVAVGGMHIKEKNKPLPKDFEDFIAKSGDKGFIYISFGSAVQISKAPKEIYDAFFNAIRRLDVFVLWKWEGDLPKDVPETVFLNKWMPQQDILAHPKIRGFVTHSGLMSIQEAIYHGVPLVGLPVFAEQDYNAVRVHTRGYGIKLEITTITADELFNAITKIVYDPKYKSKMLQISKLFKDRPMKSVDMAEWWTNYVLRHETTEALVPLSIHQCWFTRRLLDVYALLYTIMLLAIIFIYKVTRCCIRKLLMNGGNQPSTGLKKKEKTK